MNGSLYSGYYEYVHIHTYYMGFIGQPDNTLRCDIVHRQFDTKFNYNTTLIHVNFD